MPSSVTTIGIGVAGLGRAFSLMASTFAADRRVRLVGAADPRPEARAKFEAEFPARAYSTIEELVQVPGLDVVYIATPHQSHTDHACLVARHGKHVLVEKPMALTLEECRAMIDAARRSDVRLIVGHSHSFDLPILHLRKMLDTGAFGRVRMITALNFTDFLYRPRRAEELNTALGGGAVFNQAAHQVDIVRLIAGARAKSLRALTGVWDRERPTEGAYSALLTFESGAFATLVYSGYAHFDSDELCDWVDEMGRKKDPEKYVATRDLLQDEATAKARRNYGGPDFHPPIGRSFHEQFGPIIVSCDKADLRPTPSGVMIYSDTEKRLEPLAPPKIPRVEVIDELYGAVVEGKPPLHDGEWGAATVEACLAILLSAKEQREISLSVFICG
jgi:phthalate 4,5-cis-dihydrodiol dehydrogenase